jgi:hypothetical protein
MAKVRMTPRHEPTVARTKAEPEKLTPEQFEEELKDFFEGFCGPRPRNRVLWYQSLMQYANMRFHENYDKEMK